jgi:[ribosomal protein S5]-alanine N-acetyltransferase
MRIRLERLAAGREHEFLDAVRRSRALHRRFVVPPSTATEFAQYVALGRGRHTRIFLIVLEATDQIVGVVHIENISSGATRSANLGFYGFAPFNARGLIREGIAAAMKLAFRELKLHRLEANVQPGNARSIALIRSLGFAKEGYSRRFMKIAGRWRDHERWAILVEDWQDHTRRHS